MCQHGPPFVRYIKNVAMTFLALLILKGSVGLFFLQSMIVKAHVLCKMNINIFEAVHGFGVEKIDSIVRGREVTVHTVRYKTLSIVDMCGGLPGIVCIFDFVTGCTKN